jgi:light-regulated signal transduction histidine kinase (bacteriophytochrome)
MDDNEDIFGKAISQLIHDIRNPLNIIVGFSSIIQIDESVNDEIRSYLKKIFQSGMMIEQLLSNIDYYIMEKMDLEETEFDIIKETDNFFDAKKETIEEKQVTVRKFHEEKILTRISTEIYTRIFENLLQFSLKGFNVVKMKQIMIFFKKIDKDIVIYYTDTSEPLFIENDYFSFEEVLKAKRGLGLEFNSKFVRSYGGEISYKYGKKWQIIMEEFNQPVKTNHGFIIRIPGA